MRSIPSRAHADGRVESPPEQRKTPTAPAFAAQEPQTAACHKKQASGKEAFRFLCDLGCLDAKSLLPLARFDQFFDFALHQIALQGADMTDVQLPVQMIGLVQESAGQQLLPRLFVPFA